MKYLRSIKIFSLLLLVVLNVNCSEEPAIPEPEVKKETIKILPLGDSITEGEFYRYPLFKKLIDANIDFDFIGLRKGEDDFPPYKGKMWDVDHQGISGITAIDVAETIETKLNKITDTPELVLIHLGTNDAEAIGLNEASLDDVENSMRTIIKALQKRNSKVKIFLAQIIPLNTSDKDLVPQINSKWKTLATELATKESPIFLVDCNTGFSVADLVDYWHPNEQGSEKMATRFAEAILSYLGTEK